MQRDGRIGTLVTQNVDRLHTKAGTKDVLELHGSGYNVICLGAQCNYSIDRHDLQLIFNSMNQSMVDRSELMRPDGDIDIPQEYIDSFQIPECPQCGGILKPEIVFFGDSIPKARAEKLAALVCSSDGVLILGSSLLVYSGLRVLLSSHDLGLPVAIVNIGKVRGEEKATLKISAKCGDIIPKLWTTRRWFICKYSRMWYMKGPIDRPDVHKMNWDDGGGSNRNDVGIFRGKKRNSTFVLFVE